MPDAEEPALEIVCPRCSAVEHDEFEVIELRQFTRLRCWSCQGAFGVWLNECRLCGTDLSITFASSEAPGPVAEGDLCGTCLGREGQDEVDDLLSATLA